MTWADPSGDLRNLLGDEVDDKPRYRKRVLGQLNGTNVSFKTFEFRRVTNFTTASIQPLGVWLDGVLLTSSDVAVDYPVTGDFNLNVAPNDGSVIEASYYVQWFNDSEITRFLIEAVNWLNLGDDPTVIGQGLRPAALKYASASAYQKLSLMWVEALSEAFLLDDSVEKNRLAIVDTYAKQALAMRKDAISARNDFYSRNGENLQPLFGNNLGRVGDPTPKS